MSRTSTHEGCGRNFQTLGSSPCDFLWPREASPRVSRAWSLEPAQASPSASPTPPPPSDVFLPTYLLRGHDLGASRVMRAGWQSTQSGAKREKLGEASRHSGEAVEKWGLSTPSPGGGREEGFIWQDQPASAKPDGTEMYPKGSKGTRASEPGTVRGGEGVREPPWARPPRALKAGEGLGGFILLEEGRRKRVLSEECCL